MFSRLAIHHNLTGTPVSMRTIKPARSYGAWGYPHTQVNPILRDDSRVLDQRVKPIDDHEVLKARFYEMEDTLTESHDLLLKTYTQCKLMDTDIKAIRKHLIQHKGLDITKLLDDIEEEERLRVIREYCDAR